MYPWFIASLVDYAVRPFGRCVNVRALQGARGFEALSIVRGVAPDRLHPKKAR